MSFLGGAARLIGGLLGGGLLGLFGKKQKPLALPKPATRDDAVLEAERDKELAARRGASANRSAGAGGEPAGGLGRLIVGS